MARYVDPDAIPWFRYPHVAAYTHWYHWLRCEALLGLSGHTIDAYGRGLNDFLGYCQRLDLEPVRISRGEIAGFVGDLRHRVKAPSVPASHPQQLQVGLSNATLQQRLTAVRLFFDFLIEEGLRQDNPVGRGRYTPGRAFGAGTERALIARQQKLPWIPSDEQWHIFLAAARQAAMRTRCMVALAYDTGLRREELCGLASDDLDPAHQLALVRADTAKGSRERTVPCSSVTSALLGAYFTHRRTLANTRGPLFLSESHRNYARPITVWTWSKVVRQLAVQAQLPQLSTHTFRHLCLTDLARSGWDLHQIAQFAGHRNPQTTLIYIHLSGRDLSEQLAKGMDQVHAWRVDTLRRMQDTLDEPS
jgi:integrase/recombinase XerD